MQLVEGLLEGVPVFYNSTVHRIEHSGQGEGGAPVAVHTNNGSFQGER